MSEYIVREIDGMFSTKMTELVRCKDCKWFAGERMYCANNIMVTFDHFYCADGEREDTTDEDIH